MTEDHVNAVRTLLWSIPIVSTIDDSFLFAAPSNLEAAGKGLFTRKNIAAYADVCFYEGFEYCFADAIKLADKSYLMFLGTPAIEDPKTGKLFSKSARMRQDEIAVNSKYTTSVKARYINDCLNENAYNVQFVQEADKARARVVALRNIRAGEELFASYGDRYWAKLDMPRSRLLDAQVEDLKLRYQ